MLVAFPGHCWKRSYSARIVTGSDFVSVSDVDVRPGVGDFRKGSHSTMKCFDGVLWLAVMPVFKSALNLLLSPT